MSHHRRGLRRLAGNDAIVNAIEEGAIEADGIAANGLTDRQLETLRYATKLTLTPQDIEESDIASLRKVGFQDTDILHIAEVTAYYAYVNRIASGLGVALEE